MKTGDEVKGCNKVIKFRKKQLTTFQLERHIKNYDMEKRLERVSESRLSKPI